MENKIFDELSEYEKLEIDAAVIDTAQAEKEKAKKDKAQDAEKEKEKSKSSDGKKKIKNDSLKNGKVTLFDGSVAEFDKDGLAELDAAYAEYLLQIPSYKEA